MEKPPPVDTETMKQHGQEKMSLFAPQGISMLPFIRGGRDKVLVRKESRVKVGDIVLVPFDNNLILHRVYAISGTRLTLMGDGNLKGKEMVDASAVIGTAVQIIKPNGCCRKPHKAWIWRHLLPVRRPLLKLRRIWYKLRKQNPE